MDPECALMMGVSLVTLLHRFNSCINVTQLVYVYSPLQYTLTEPCLISTQTIRKHPMTVYGDGKQTRSFQYVSDLVGKPASVSVHSDVMIGFSKQCKRIYIYCRDI